MTGLEQLALAGKLMTAEIPTDYSELMNRLDDTVDFIVTDMNNTQTFTTTAEMMPLSITQFPSDFLDDVQPTFESLWQQKIFKRLAFPRHWEEEGIAKPNMAVKTQCLSAIKELYNRYQLAPSTILASIEEGICVKYDRATAWEDQSLIIEFYNDMEIALIVTDNEKREVVYREDVRSMNFDHAVEAFQNHRR